VTDRTLPVLLREQARKIRDRTSVNSDVLLVLEAGAAEIEFLQAVLENIPARLQKTLDEIYHDAFS
jgi:hypothetical protein